MKYYSVFEVSTTPEAPAAIAMGAVTELSPEEDITGIRTAREIEYAAARDGVAYTHSSNTFHLSLS